MVADDFKAKGVFEEFSYLDGAWHK